VALPLLPDLLAVAIQAVRAQPAVQSAVGARVYDRVPASPVWPLLVVSVVDNGERSPSEGSGRFQVDVWGSGPGDTASAAAHTIARAVVAASRDMRGTWPAGTITNSGVAMGPLEQPDDETGRARWVVDLYVDTSS
jgi:hypothetical protein